MSIAQSAGQLPVEDQNAKQNAGNGKESGPFISLSVSRSLGYLWKRYRL
jgi:hypothetical protein